MRHTRLLVALPALLCLACPGDWDEPLGPAHGGHIDSKLVGDWRCDVVGEATKFRLAILPFDDDQYVMTLVGLGEKKEFDTIWVRAFTTTVSGHDVMNVRVLDDDPKKGGWSYMRFHFPKDGHLAIDPVRKEPLRDVPDDVESRRAAIGDVFESPELWEDGYRCVPFKPEPATK